MHMNAGFPTSVFIISLFLCTVFFYIQNSFVPNSLISTKGLSISKLTFKNNYFRRNLFDILVFSNNKQNTNLILFSFFFYFFVPFQLNDDEVIIFLRLYYRNWIHLITINSVHIKCIFIIPAIKWENFESRRKILQNSINSFSIKHWTFTILSLNQTLETISRSMKWIKFKNRTYKMELERKRQRENVEWMERSW